MELGLQDTQLVCSNDNRNYKQSRRPSKSKTKSINNDASDHEMSSTKSIVDLGNALCTHWSRHIDKHKNESFQATFTTMS